MIDHHGYGGALEPRRELFDERCFEMHLQVPAELREALAQRYRLIDSRTPAQVRHEVEPHAAEPERVQALELGVLHRRGQERHAAVVAVLRRDRVGDDAVVEAVAGGLDDHAMLYPQHGVQREEFLLGRIGGGERKVLPQGEKPRRPQHRDLRVAGPPGRRELRGARGPAPPVRTICRKSLWDTGAPPSWAYRAGRAPV